MRIAVQRALQSPQNSPTIVATDERLSVKRSRLSAAGDGQRYLSSSILIEFMFV